MILGITFKENCPDIRNTKVVDIYHTLKEYTDNIIVCDPLADSQNVKKEYGIDITASIPSKKFDAVILAVSHKEFLSLDIKSMVKDGGVIYDVKGVLDRNLIDGRL